MPKFFRLHDIVYLGNLSKARENYLKSRRDFWKIAEIDCNSIAIFQNLVVPEGFEMNAGMAIELQIGVGSSLLGLARRAA